MPTPELNLDQNPAFLADLNDESLTNEDIHTKWGCSNGYVGDRRARLKRGEPLDPKEARFASMVDADNITTNDDGTKRFDFIRHRPVTMEDARNLVRATGDDPDLYNFSIRAIAYGDGMSSNKISAWPKAGMALVNSVKLEHLYAEAARTPRPRTTERPRTLGTVVVTADWQAGKTGRRGGTPELLERLTAAREAVEKELRRRLPQRILMLEGGDPIEGFDSGGDPQFTNDLSMPDQLDFYTTEWYKFLELAHSFAPVEAGVVPSNHAGWRRAKQQLGRPSDDYGIYMHKEIRKRADAAGLDATWHFPEPYDESLCIDFQGTAIGLVHGNQFGPGKAIDWWQAQAFGDQAITRADVLCSAHYHSFGAGVAGINPFSKRERMWLGAPTLDSGSDWYRNIKGRDSLPGTMIFDVTDRGFDLSSLTIV